MNRAIGDIDHLLDVSNIGYWRLHVPSGEVTRNGAFMRLTQVSRQDLIGGLSAWAERIHAADRPAVLEKRRQLLAGEISEYSSDYRIVRPDGGWVALRAHVTVQEHDGNNTPLWICGITTDVSREYKLEHKLHALIDRPFQNVFLLTPSGRIADSSVRLLKPTDDHRGYHLGTSLWDHPRYAKLPEVQRQIMNGILSAVAGELVRFDIALPGDSSTRRVYDFTLTPLRDDGGSIVNIIAEERDISEYARTQEALATSQKRLDIATHGLNIGIWESDPATGNVWCNDECYRMLGYEPDGSLKTVEDWTALIHPDDKHYFGPKFAEQMICEGEDSRVHYRVRCMDGSYRWLMSRACATERGPDQVATRMSGVRIDITELKEMELQLASAQRLESLGQLAAGVAHEINTPIQYVNDSLFFIREAVQELLVHLSQLAAPPGSTPDSDLAYLQENLPSALDRAIEGLSRLSEIVRSMKEFSLPDQQEMAAIDLNRAIQSTLIVARNEYKYVATVDVELGDVPPVMCFGSQINQVVLQLLVNAAHAIGERVKGTAAIGIITLKTYRDGGDAVISVGDTGGGIPESIRDRIFEPFFTTKEVGRGTGQGLTIVRNSVVKNHHGSVYFETATGIGTTFYVRLPVESLGRGEEFRAA